MITTVNDGLPYCLASYMSRNGVQQLQFYVAAAAATASFCPFDSHTFVFVHGNLVVFAPSDRVRLTERRWCPRGGGQPATCSCFKKLKLCYNRTDYHYVITESSSTRWAGLWLGGFLASLGWVCVSLVEWSECNMGIVLIILLGIMFWWPLNGDLCAQSGYVGDRKITPLKRSTGS